MCRPSPVLSGAWDTVGLLALISLSMMECQKQICLFLYDNFYPLFSFQDFFFLKTWIILNWHEINFNLIFIFKIIFNEYFQIFLMNIFSKFRYWCFLELEFKFFLYNLEAQSMVIILKIPLRKLRYKTNNTFLHCIFVQTRK